MVMTEQQWGKVLTPYDKLIQPDPLLQRMYEFPEGDPIISAELIMEHCPDVFFPLDPPNKRYEKLVNRLIGDFQFARTYNVGFMVLTGPIGAGKDTGLTWWAMVMRMLWPTRPLLAEFYFKPRFKELFGEYTFVNPQILYDWGLQMEKLGEEMGTNLSENDIRDWIVEGEGGERQALKLRNAICLVNELRTWFYKRVNMSKTNRLGTGLLADLRHAHMMWIGATQYLNELDPEGCQKKINYHVECRPDAERPDWFNYAVHKIHGFSAGGWQAMGDSSLLQVYGRDVYPFFWSDAPVDIMPKTSIIKPKPKKEKKKKQDEYDDDD